jgi:Zn-dependent protease
MDYAQIAQQIAVYALPVLLAITLHEAAHGYVARSLGDLTAHRAGRITLNPLRHVDPVGTVLVPAAMLLAAGFLFGWARPVPVNFAALRSPKRDMFWVAAAGPASNLAMALVWTALLAFGAALMPPAAAEWFVKVCAAGMLVNVILAILNLLPLPPLDGGRIAVSLLPPGLAGHYARVEPYGLLILIALLLTGLLGAIVWPPIRYTMTALCALFGLSPHEVDAILRGI